MEALQKRLLQKLSLFIKRSNRPRPIYPSLASQHCPTAVSIQTKLPQQFIFLSDVASRRVSITKLRFDKSPNIIPDVERNGRAQNKMVL